MWDGASAETWIYNYSGWPSVLPNYTVSIDWKAFRAVYTKSNLQLSRNVHEISSYC